ncbi:VWA domain-containing protein [Nibrella viscosa]|uniref:VWA domain-containing protein n=1 Tax=Nibrella viscosa TaxID=1084524 RepID=A0ABP8KFX7_9BACT
MAPWFSLRWFTPGQWQQFHFDHPLALYAIPAVLLLFGLRYLLHRGAGQRLSLSFSPRTSPRRDLLDSVLNRLRYLLPLSAFMAVALILVALARPQIIREQKENQSEGIDIMLAMDVSSSMTEKDLKPDRLTAAKRVAQTFIADRQNDRIGLVIFAGEAFSLCPLTTDNALVKQYLNQVNHHIIRTSGTAIGDALARCINRMRESHAKSKVVILLSDGDNTAGSLDPITAARLAKAFDIKVYTIVIGRPPKGAASATQTTDEGILKTIASISEGSFYRAGDVGKLQRIFAEINRLEKAPVRTQVYQDVQDYYRVYLYWALAFLLLALLLKNTIFGNILED